MLLKNRGAMLLLVAILMPLALVGQQEEQHCSDYLYGLYYGGWDKQGSDLAFVISPDGKPIPPKVNDPEAPTQPGFYVAEQRFRFASSHFSPQGFSFRTNTVNGMAFSFHGRFRCEQIEEVGQVPYLEGELREMRNGRVMRKQKVHFGHAVVL